MALHEDNTFMTDRIEIPFSEGMFYGFYIILTVVKGMGLYEGMLLYEAGLAAAFLCLFLKLIAEKYEKRELLFTIVLLTLGILIWQTSGKMGALFNIALLVGMKGIRREQIIRRSAVLWAGLFSLQCFLSLSGLRRQQIFRIHRKLGTYIVRWSMGFTHPNVLHITYFVLVAFVMYAWKPRGRRLLRWSFLSMIGNLAIFAYSVSYTGVALVTLYLALNLALQRIDQKGDKGNGMERAARTVVHLLPAVSMLFSVIGPVALKGKAFALVNKALSTRFELSRQYLLGQGIHLWGTRNMEVADATITVDSSYVYMLVHYGFIYFLLFAILLECAVVYYWRKRDFYAVAILLACAVSGITEQYMANTSFKNIAVLLAAVMVHEVIGKRSLDGRENSGLVAMPFANKTLKVPQLCGGNRWVGESIRKRFQKKRKSITVTAGLFFLLGTVVYRLCVTQPSAIYASPWDCDRKEGAAGEAYVYDYEILADSSFNGWILSNNDALGKLYDFTGETVYLEYWRRALGAGMALAILVVWFECGAAVLEVKKRR